MQMFTHFGPISIHRDEKGLIDLQKTFRAQLDYLLGRKDYTYKKLAKETGISVNTISMYRNNKREIRTGTFERLINHLLLQPDKVELKDIL